VCSASSYEPIAGEYYESTHVTSRNFDAADKEYLRSKRGLLSGAGFILDVGAGRGGVCELLRVQPSRVIQVDISRQMLALGSREASRARVQADALQLPFRDGAFAVVAALLFDPFNRRCLYQEVGRLLRAGGYFLGTLPTQLWGETLRRLRGYSTAKARFVTQAGQILDRDSLLISERRLRTRLEEAGFAQIDIRNIALQGRAGRVSPDIVLPARALGLDPDNLEIILAFTAKKD